MESLVATGAERYGVRDDAVGDVGGEGAVAQAGVVGERDGDCGV